MLVTVVIIFSLCWLPYHVYFLASMSQPSVNQFKYINLIFLISHWLAMSNSCCNPFIYCICSPTFRWEKKIGLAPMATVILVALFLTNIHQNQHRLVHHCIIFKFLGMNLSTSFVGVREKMKEKLATQILNKLTCSASKCLYFEERKDKLMTNKDIKPTYFAQSFCLLHSK